jgi:hypothetical protein
MRHERDVGVVRREVRKQFFFEKKNQKTFATSDRGQISTTGGLMTG